MTQPTYESMIEDMDNITCRYNPSTDRTKEIRGLALTLVCRYINNYLMDKDMQGKASETFIDIMDNLNSDIPTLLDRVVDNIKVIRMDEIL